MKSTSAFYKGFISKLSVTSLNVSMAILIFMPIGWGIIVSILFLEVFLFYIFLRREYQFRKLLAYLTISNMASGVIGLILSLIQNGGWLGVFWFPWVSSHEIEFMSRTFIIYFIIVFLITIAIETPINILLFKRIGIEWKKTLNVSLVCNVITNIGCAFIIYLFSFNLIRI